MAGSRPPRALLLPACALLLLAAASIGHRGRRANSLGAGASAPASAEPAAAAASAAAFARAKGFGSSQPPKRPAAAAAAAEAAATEAAGVAAAEAAAAAFRVADAAGAAVASAAAEAGSAERPRKKGFAAAAAASVRQREYAPSNIVDTQAIDVEPTAAELDPQDVSGLQVIVAGGGMVGLWLALLLAAELRGRARIRVYEPRWERGEDGRLRWKAGGAAQDGRRMQVASLPARLWSRLSPHVREEAVPAGSFAEAWPRSAEQARKGEGFARDMELGALEDGLLRAVQLEEFEADVELLPKAYDTAAHSSVCDSDRFHLLVAADGEPAQASRDLLLAPALGRPVPRLAGVPERTLALSIDLSGSAASSPLGVAASAAVSLAQRRYLLQWSAYSADSRRCTLHMRLSREEADQAFDALAPDASAALRRAPPSGPFPRLPFEDAAQRLVDSPLLVRLREGLKLYGLPEEAVGSLALFSSDVVERPVSMAELEDASSPQDGVPHGIVVGDSARAGSAHFGPGFGSGSLLEAADALATALVPQGFAASLCRGGPLPKEAAVALESAMTEVRDRDRGQAGVGVPDSLSAALAGGGGQQPVEARSGFFIRLQASCESLVSAAADGRLPGAEDLVSLLEDGAEQPGTALCRRLEAAGLQAETFSAMAASGPRSFPEVGLGAATSRGDGAVTERTAADLYDKGGETEEGTAHAANLEDIAMQGNGGAAMELGIMYLTADGVDKDEARGLKFITLAAESGIAEAQNCLGSILRNGMGVVEPDRKMAAACFRKAALMGDVEAMFNLGDMLYDGDGVKQDLQEAMKWFREAADEGLGEAKLKVGSMLQSGFGVEKDTSQALRWLTEAADSGQAEASVILGTMAFLGDGVPTDRAAAAKHFLMAAEQGDPQAQYSLGVMCELGDGVERDAERSQYWFRKAAALGLVEAQARVRQEKLLPA